MARHLDLRTGRPVWFAYPAPRVPAEPLTRDVRADVLVVGMGISGAMAAEALTAEGLSVVMIDRRGPLRGSTPATTALVQFEIDTPLTQLGRMIGDDAAARAWRRSRLAVLALQARIEALGIACNMAPRRSLYLAGNVLRGAALRAEAEARRAAGLYADYLTAAPLREAYGIDRDGAIVSHGNLALDPRRLTAGLLNAALARGARAYAPVEATGFEASREGVAVGTAGGPVVSAGHVVLATGYELAGPAPAKGHEIVSTWAIATRPQRNRLWPHEAFMWEASDPYLYLRATRDGRIVCGGEDEPFEDETRRDALIAEKSSRIVEKLARLLPGVDPTPDFAWAGAFGTTTTGLPRIGPLPGTPRLFAVLGYGGNGVTFSRLAAELAVAHLAGREDRDADLFAFPC
jgi:glycine/D-amino acid oxidase-like deaminating enzyme